MRPNCWVTARTNESVATGGFSCASNACRALARPESASLEVFRQRWPTVLGGIRHAAIPAARSSRHLIPSPCQRPATKRSRGPVRRPLSSVDRARRNGTVLKARRHRSKRARSAAGLASVGGLPKRSKYQRSSVRIGSFSGDASCPHATFCRSCTAPSRCAGTTIRIVQAGSRSSSGAWRWRKLRNSSCIGSACR